jgi:hypothetical protein
MNQIQPEQNHTIQIGVVGIASAECGCTIVLDTVHEVRSHNRVHARERRSSLHRLDSCEAIRNPGSVVGVISVSERVRNLLN